MISRKMSPVIAFWMLGSLSFQRNSRCMASTLRCLIGLNSAGTIMLRRWICILGSSWIKIVASKSKGRPELRGVPKDRVCNKLIIFTFLFVVSIGHIRSLHIDKPRR